MRPVFLDYKPEDNLAGHKLPVPALAMLAILDLDMQNGSLSLDIIFDLGGCAERKTRYVARMDWQARVSLLIVAATAGLFVWAKIRPRKFSFQKDTHCGCSAVSESAARNRIIFRARKGGRSEVLVKMK